jgi:long-chain acyl-CoA synthetase
MPLPALAGRAIAGRWGVPASLLSYFSESRRYRRDNVERLLGPYVPDWEAILPQLLEYAASRGFLRRSGRTVHEQFVQRLQSKNLPIRIHDMSEGIRIRPRSGVEMCNEIRMAAEGLRALGIEPGDRVALVGINSSRFLSLDMAIGLTGAVSVPLYYTAPIPEIEEILRASGARMLLVGAPAMLARLDGISSPAIIVSFCKGPLPAGLARRVLPWENFIRLGAQGTANAAAVQAATTHAAAGAAVRGNIRREPVGRFVPEAPVAFSDLATLRFTSGTTGAPKGVMFRHGQVLWLAEVLASLLPWKARTRPARYLSFLPMNHVVEGILGTYAPSYIPAPMDIFFLEDFHALSRALPLVRPTVFFSVPRFYEKVWARFVEGFAGRLYLSLPSNRLGNTLRRTLRPILRISLLRRAGLDKCAQIIAGSAPCAAGLLESFRELGIEIHNAYGLTEAPLVTLNRYGANSLGTVGTPLPDTRVRLASDGEVLVRGPQVTAGCFGGSTEDILRDGWLHTGDLGDLDQEGRLIIRGRKKEILITSYGKNIHPVKIESMLRNIPGMTEAMVIGDNEPALSALLWLKEGSVTPAVLTEIDMSVRRVNGWLSHPEQVKRWAILSDSPAIDNGELTGNLKLRRQVVLARRAKVVEMLYDKRRRGELDCMKQRVPGVLHVGESQCA